MNKINLTTLLVLIVFGAFSKKPVDSLGVETVNGKSFILHKVNQDETLYSLLRRYKCTAGDVLAANPSLDNGSKIYPSQVLRFPTYKPLKKVEAKKGKELVTKIATSKGHIVVAGETVFSISQKYKLSVDDFKKLNFLSENNIKLGQILATNIEESKSIYAKKYSSLAEAKTEEVEFEKQKTNRLEPVIEIGLAEIIKTGRRSTKHLALHRYAPKGSYIMIKNEANGKKVVAKIIGKLPETGENDNVLVRISPSAFNKLGPKDKHLRAEITYHIPKSI